MIGGIVLAGGRSSRMGRAKAGLEWHGSTLLRRVAGIVERSVDGPIVIVRSAGQALPKVPAAYEVVDDAHDGRGPLEGIAAGLRALSGRAELAYVSCTDVPLLHTSFVGAVLGGIGVEDEICVPVIGRRWHPLAAVYRTGVARVVEELLDAEERRVSRLLDRCRVRRLDAAALLSNAELAAGDPQLESVVNLNDPDAYRAARALPAAEIAVSLSGGWEQVSGPLRTGRDDPWGSVRAATLGALADAVDVDLDRPVLVSVNGTPTSREREFPLERGDAVAFSSLRG